MSVDASEPKIAPICQIETDRFLFEFISLLAQRESWRKEVYRPVYHVHKWWAKRLGSIFRAIVLGSILPEDADLESAFYQKSDFSNVKIFDPFMGSGTTVGEAHKLGCTALGRDINPIACESVRVALGALDRKQLQDAFRCLEITIAPRLQQLYRSVDEKGNVADVLYYFWVKYVACPHCTGSVDLFSSWVFARNADAERKPEVQIYCPRCGDVFEGMNHSSSVSCSKCSYEFDPQAAPAQGAKATCPHCSKTFAILDAVRQNSSPPSHRLYAKLLLTSRGEKRYLAITPQDIAAYRACSLLLDEEVRKGSIHLPEAILTDGFNTRQALNYNYHRWRDFFNDRQLLALGWLQSAIMALEPEAERDALLALFSGLLEFNNMFATYKGEGTGAVRHMFSHHILKPERMPIEANVWGTPKSSGSFLNLYEIRLLRALDYRAAPFEVKLRGSGKAYATNQAFSGKIEDTWPSDGVFEPRGVYLSCGSSDATDLPDRCIDMVITDPPFFDNVHYSELADFFFAWQSLYPHGFIQPASTTRHSREVQDANADQFSAKLQAVFSECNRILKDDGLLVFTYHHSRSEGWTSLAQAVIAAGFSIVNAHPVKAEMSVATPKSQAKEPIQLDIILTCRKKERDGRRPLPVLDVLNTGAHRAFDKLARLRAVGLELSQNDRRIVLISQLLAVMGPVDTADEMIEALTTFQPAIEELLKAPAQTDKELEQQQGVGVPRQLQLF